MKRQTTALILTATLLLLSAPGRCETGVGAKEILIGACTPLSGIQQALGANVLAGGKAYLGAVNEKGGVNGRTIRVIEHDDRWDPEAAVSCFGQLEAEKVFMGAFLAGAPQSVNYARLAQSHKLPILILSGLGVLHEPLKRYVFTVRGTFDDEAALLMSKLLTDAKATRFCVVSQEDALGAAIQNAVRSTASKSPAAAVTTVLVPRGESQDDKVAEQVSGANPEVVVLGAAYAVVVSVIKAVRAAGSKPLFVIMTRGVSADRLAHDLGPAAEGIVISQGLPPTDRKDLSAIAEYDRLLKKYSPGTKPTPEGLDGFLQAKVLVEGLKRAGAQSTRETWIDAVQSFGDLDLGLGPRFKAHYSPTRHRAMDNFVYTVVREGKAEEIADWASLVK